ncbi:MAG: phosphodiester glycosidase family protein [Gemmatimonadaceae bacterium]|nr:phosphodiester glycosidase family protein [Gemmatimonadaceae bacterium]
MTLSPAPCGVSFAAPAARVTWRDSSAGLAWGEWSVRPAAYRLPVRLIVVRIAPRAFRWALDVQRVEGVLQPWRLGAVGDSVTVALNVGQFTDEGPWGWLVHEARERQVPGVGPLAGAVTMHRDGTVRVHDARELTALRGDTTVVEAFQSFPTLLDARSQVPAALCRARDGVDPEHRDIRFAIGTRADGQVLLVLSRLDTDVPLADRTPLGPTTREMAMALRALGATRALLLDGGLSAQLLVRTNAGARKWPGLRVVPLGLVLVPREPAARR